METDLLSTLTDKFNDIKSNLSENIGKIELIDLHLKHLLINQDVFENYQSSVSKIENMCTEIQKDIIQLRNSKCDYSYETNIDNITNFDKINQSNTTIENKINSIDEYLQVINKNINSVQNSVNVTDRES